MLLRTTEPLGRRDVLDCPVLEPAEPASPPPPPCLLFPVLFSASCCLGPFWRVIGIISEGRGACFQKCSLMFPEARGGACRNAQCPLNFLTHGLLLPLCCLEALKKQQQQQQQQ